MTKARTTSAQAAFRPDLGTPERRAKGDVYVTKAAAKSDRKARAISKVEQLFLAGKISEPQLAAALKLAIHRWRSGWRGLPKSPCLERVDGSPVEAAGLSADEHDAIYTEARRLIAGPHSPVTLAFVIDDKSLEYCAGLLGLKRSTGIPFCAGIVSAHLQMLALHWGLTSPTENCS